MLIRILVALLFTLVCTAQQPAVAIRNVRLFDGTRVVPSATVVFRDGVIVAAGANAKVPEGAQVIDGTGKTLLPGLIDSHTHVFGPVLERALRFGVTTELDMFTAVATLKLQKAEQASGNVATRADIFSAGTLVTVKGGHGTEYFPIVVYTPGDDAQAFIDARIAEGSDYIKLVYEDGVPFGLQYPSLTKDDLRKLIAATHARKKLAVVHISTLEGARIAIEAGADGLVHLFGEKAPDAELGKFIAAHRAFVVPTLTVIESTAGVQSGASLTEDARLKPFLSAEEVRGLHSSFPRRATSTIDIKNAFATVRQLDAAGVRILAGTDAPNPGTMHGASMHRELELLVQAGLTPIEALTAATATPAAAFDLKDRGRIAPGLRADLLLVDGDPTHDISATRAIDTVWKGGVALERRPEAVAKPEAVAGNLGDGTISTFESGETNSAFGFGWTLSDDSFMGGKSKVSMEVVSNGANGTAKSLLVHSHIQPGFAFPWAGAMYFPGSEPMKPVNVSAMKGISFFARGDVDLNVMVFAESLGRIPSTKLVHAGADWTEITIPWSDFGIDGKDLTGVLIGGGQKSGKADFQIDEVKLK
ncbi:MAG TPA: amidohydrolase family protein [Thermoanaerobaculia bacterium]|jgi:imidazolonepropionase-like amidohydrolase|nr:amidohydrolase family protein [Thermoanaerobaculia bacterium]